MLQANGYIQTTELDTAVCADGTEDGANIPDGSNMILLQAEDQDIRWRDDGTDPTATVGNLIAAGAIIEYNAMPLKNLKIIAATAGAILNANFYKER